MKRKQYIRDGRAPIPASENISKVMSANRAKNSKPELLLRKALWAGGQRGYRLHPRNLPGTPDIAFGKSRLAIFINGCFWHRCPTCGLPLPKSNTEFWSNKFNANVARDIKKNKVLRSAGWQTITLWECNIAADPHKCAERIARTLERLR